MATIRNDALICLMSVFTIDVRLSNCSFDCDLRLILEQKQYSAKCPRTMAYIDHKFNSLQQIRMISVYNSGPPDFDLRCLFRNRCSFRPVSSVGVFLPANQSDTSCGDN